MQLSKKENKNTEQSHARKNYCLNFSNFLELQKVRIYSNWKNINCGIEQNEEFKIFAEFLLKIGISKFAELLLKTGISKFAELSKVRKKGIVENSLKLKVLKMENIRKKEI